MDTIQQIIEHWCGAHQISAQTVDERVFFSVDGANGRFPAAVFPLEEDGAVVCVFGLGPFVPEDRRDEAARQLARLNYDLKLGTVQLCAETGEVTLRVTQLLPDGGEEAAAVVERTLLLSAHAMDQLLPALTRLCCP